MKSTIEALLVEDSSSDAQLLQAIISSSELNAPQLHHAERFETALDMLESNVFDVVLLDLHLPDGQGLSLIKRLKQFVPQVPVVVLTGTQDPTLAEAAIQEGAQDYVVKSDAFSPGRLAQLGYVDVGNLLVQRIQYAIKRSESLQTLAMIEERHTLIAEGANDGIWDWDLQQDCIYYSAKWQQLLGLENMGNRPEEWLSRIHPEDRSRFQQTLQNYLTQQQSKFQCEYRLQHQDGSYLWVLTKGIAIRDQSGIAQRIVGFQINMTVGPKSEDLALQAQEFAQTTLHTLTIGLVSNLAELYLYEGRYGEAEPLLQGVLAMRTWLLGPTHMDVALSLYNLAKLYDNQGLYKKAYPIFQEALKLFEKNLGPEHTYTKNLRRQIWLLDQINHRLEA